jgi:hypothetical protein
VKQYMTATETDPGQWAFDPPLRDVNTTFTGSSDDLFAKLYPLGWEFNEDRGPGYSRLFLFARETVA